MSWFFTLGCLSIGVSASASELVLPVNIQGLSPLGLTGFISLLSKDSAFSHPYIITRKNIALNIWTFAGKVMSLLFNKLYVCHSFPFKEQRPFNFLAEVTICSDFWAQENKICYSFYFFPIYCQEMMELGAMLLVFWMLSFKPVFFTLLFYCHQEGLCSSSLSSIRVVILHIWGCWYFSQISWFQFVIHPVWPFTWGTLHIN